MILVTGGCSFSECISTTIDTWPRHLACMLNDSEHISTAMGSQGNGLISRQIIYTVTELLKTHSSDDLLIGIMWSGPDRYDFYLRRTDGLHQNIDGWIENPTSVVKDSNNWVILNHHWKNQYAKAYYSTFHDNIGSLIYTYEHILRVQWFLKLHNIKYFMTTYTGEVFPKNHMYGEDVNHTDLKHLYEQIDLLNFLDVEGEYEWCRDNTDIVFASPGDKHPSTEQHKLFVEQVIVPHLKDKGHI